VRVSVRIHSSASSSDTCSSQMMPATHPGRLGFSRTAPDGQVTGVRYAVFTDWARPDGAIVCLQLILRWSGTAKVTSLIDGTLATQPP